MDWAPGGEQLWKIIRPLNPILLTSPGLFQFAKAGKKQWVDKHCPGTALFFSDSKSEFTERDSILIDDMLDNVGGWKRAGGIAFQFKNNPEEIERELLSLIHR
jgi:hypothetical protein